MKKLILNSYAKLNLYLLVLNKRGDNYHNIKTVFERIDLSDKIILIPRQDNKIKIISSARNIPKDSSNLAYRSAKLLQNRFNINRGADIKIIKHIPVGGGLGGGSSNAASVLVALNKLWGLNLDRDKLAGLAKKIGCDVPFFIYNAPFALGVARGDRIRILDTLSKVRLWHILAVPKTEVSTELIYNKWDIAMKSFKETLSNLFGRESSGILKKAGLTRPSYDVKMLTSALRKKDLFLISKALFNSLQEVTAKLYPEVARIKEKLGILGVKAILMSGSGPAIFGIVHSRKEAVSLCRQLREENKSWRVFTTSTI
jgi:4-diphosphocytidyl-2-C-methyl-D-erythritol kinase